MHFTLDAVLTAAGLFAGVLLFLELGRRIGLRHVKQEGDGAAAGVGVVEGAIFALLGLLIAFTFSGAATRFEDRRNLIVDEANAVGTAYLRIDLLPAAAQGEMRDRFRRYLDARLAVYRALPDLQAANEHLASSNRIQQEIWARGVAESADSQSARMLLLPALNEMFDITTKRTMAAQSHPPNVVFGLLFVFALCAALLAGSAMARPQSRHWLHSVTFAFALAGSVYVIIDMEFPRVGLIRVDAFDNVLVELRRSME
jgi:phosphotransferase system  glucose/maltose/N-acetylglucosamine-specific IIC component